MSSNSSAQGVSFTGDLGFWYGLSRPSPSPMYKGQNDLPVGWSGQLPFVCICITLNATGHRIANYIRFWKERHESSQASAVILGNADADTVHSINKISEHSQRKSRRLWFQNGNRGSVTPLDALEVASTKKMTF